MTWTGRGISVLPEEPSGICVMNFASDCIMTVDFDIDRPYIHTYIHESAYYSTGVRK